MVWEFAEVQVRCNVKGFTQYEKELCCDIFCTELIWQRMIVSCDNYDKVDWF